MQRLIKLTYYASICYIIVCCVVVVLMYTLPLEFKSQEFSERSSGYILFGIPSALFFTMARFGFRENGGAKVLSKIIRAVFVAVGVFVLFFMFALASFGGSMCDTTTGKTIFIRKNSGASKIVTRHFGCGATDSSPARVSIAEQTEVFSLFWYYRRIDTTAINQSEWIRVHE